jgi:hypothetical protein
MLVHNVAQGTKAWLDVRKGIPTASLFDNIVTPGGAPSRSAPKYMAHLLAERVLGQPIDGFQSQWMARGSELEERAVASYELEHECDTERIGFVTTDDGRIGCSPDRFIFGTDELLEAKAPTAAVHIGYLLAAAGASTEYKVQLQAQLWVCEKKAVNIISFYPGMPNAVFRVDRDEKFIDQLSRGVRTFSDVLEETAAMFAERGWIKPPAEDEQDTAGFLTEKDLEWARNREYSNG